MILQFYNNVMQFPSSIWRHIFVLIYEAIPDAIPVVVCCKIIPYPRVLLFIIKYTGSAAKSNNVVCSYQLLIVILKYGIQMKNTNIN